MTLKKVNGWITTTIENKLKEEDKTEKFIEHTALIIRQQLDVQRFATAQKLKTRPYRDNFAPLSKTKLEEINRSLPRVLRELVKLNIFEKDGKYEPGAKCISYRLNKQYMMNEGEELLFDANTRGCFKVKHIESAPILKKYNKFKAQKEEQLKKLKEEQANAIELITADEQHIAELIHHATDSKTLYDFYETLKVLRIDAESAFKYITQTTNKEITDIRRSKKSKKIKEKIIADIERKARFACGSIDAITEKEYFFKVDTFSGRIHTNLTTLKSELRQFLYFEFDYKKQYSMIDIKNSQPFIFAQLFDKNTQNEFKNILKDYIQYFDSNEDRRPQDVKDFIEHATNGTIYEYYADKTNLTRAEIKQTLFATIFYKEDPDGARHSKTAKKLMNITPNIFRIAHKVKTHTHKPDQYREMARLLQMIETQYMFKIITPALKSEYMNFFLTIHDSVFINEIHKKNTIITINKAFKAKGLTPPKLKNELSFND